MKDHLTDSTILLHTECVIDAAHRLEGYEGKCRFFHGHSWLLRIWIKGKDDQLDKVGILFDFGGVKTIREKLDHKMINDVLDTNPTAEHIATWIISELHKMDPRLKYRVRLYETYVGKKTYCERKSKNF